MKRLRLYACCLPWLACPAAACLGQGVDTLLHVTQRDYSRWSVALGGGAAFQWVDVDAQIGPQGYLQVEYAATRSLTLGLVGNYSQLQSRSDDEFDRSFSTQALYAGGRATLSLQNLLEFQDELPKLRPWVGIGVGRMFMEVSDVTLPDGQGRREGSRQAWVINPSLGVDIRLGSRLDLQVAVHHQWLNDDYLDGHNEAFTGNRSNDQLSHLTGGLRWNLGGKGKEPLVWRNKRQESVEELQRLLRQNAPKRSELLADADQDGVPDGLDRDPATPPGVRVNTRGEPLDTDYDGIADYQDPCPLVAGADGQPCPPPPAASPAATDSLEASAEARALPDGQGIRYYIVAGSMSRRDNAEKLVRRLKGLGYAATQVLEPRPTTVNGAEVLLYRVVVEQFGTKRAALEALAPLRRKLDPKLWIYYER